MSEIDPESVRALVARLTLEEKVRLLTGRDSWSLHPLPSIGLRSLVLSDGPVGVRGDTWDERSPSVNFPSPTAVAASWDRSVVRSVGHGLGSEARRKGVDVVLAPTINLQRTPYGGRHFEAFSEDPVLTAELATEYVRGIQSYGVGATVKHYVANDSETERFTVDVRVGERTLRELYLLAFEQPVVEGRAWLVMSAYNSINGATASENPLLETPLNDEWGFDGVVVSDWTAVRSLASANYPQDLAMPGPGGPWGEALVRAVRNGQIPERLVDRKVERILRLAARVGALDAVPAAPHTAAVLSEQAARDIARSAAVSGTVLLENRGLLPLGSVRSFAVIGEGARVARTQGGGSATVLPASVVSPLEGIRARWPDALIDWALGAVVHRGLADLPPGSFTTPDGEPGMTVSYIDGAGTVLHSERREASGIVSFDARSFATKSATVEMSFTYRPESLHDGKTRLGVAGVSDYEVLADGAVVAAGKLRTAPGDDLATAVLTPPFASFDVPVDAKTVDVVVRFSPVGGEIPDAFTLRVGVAPLEVDPEELLTEAAQVAAAADVAVVVVSTTPEVESEGFDRTSLALPGRQNDLVRAVAAANPRTVVVVNAGAPVLLPWRHQVGAAVTVWFPGQEFGTALADVLSGDAEPGGRLPVTWPDTEGDLPVSNVLPRDGRLDYVEGIDIGHRAWLRAAATPAYPFGHGLGYTRWHVEAIDCAGDVAMGDQLSVAIQVRNTGARQGKAVVQLYLERVTSSLVQRPVRWLAGFGTVLAEPGSTATVAVTIGWRRFAHWDAGWRVEPGEYLLRAGLSVDDLTGPTVTIRIA